MRFKTTALLSSLFVCVLAITGCSNDDEKSLSPLKEKTYDSSSGLSMYYNGNPIPGKTVEIIPEANSAKIKVYSIFNLDQLSALGLSGEINGPGVLPGTPVWEKEVTLSPSDGYWEFTGADATDYCSFSYAGYANESELKFYISDAKLNFTLPVTYWKPAPIVKTVDSSYSSYPLFFTWDFEPLPNVDINFTPLVQELLTSPIIPDNTGSKVSLGELFSQVIKGISMLPDGNILFDYINTVGGAPFIAQTDLNRFQYVVATQNVLKIYPDPMTVLGMYLVASSGGTPADEVNLTGTGLFPSGKVSDNSGNTVFTDSPLIMGLIKVMLRTFLSQCANGFPFAFTTSEEGCRIYIDTPIMIGIAKALLETATEEPQITDLINEYLQSNPEFAQLLPDLKTLLTILSQAIEHTNKMQLGVVLIPSNS